MIRFTVPAVPVPQPRQRTSAYVAPNGALRARNYTSAKHPVNAFKAAVQMAFSEAYAGAPLAGPVELRLHFVLPRPQSKRWKRKPMPREWHAGTRADADNLAKAVMDALDGLAWLQDGQVSRLCIEKVVAAGDETPCATVEISEAGDCQ